MCHCVACYLRRISGFHKWNGKPFGTHLKRYDQNFFFPLTVHKKQATNYHSQLSPVLTAIGWDIELQSADLCYQITNQGERARAKEAMEKRPLGANWKMKVGMQCTESQRGFRLGRVRKRENPLRATAEWNKLSWSYDLALPTYPPMVINVCQKQFLLLAISSSKRLIGESRWRWCVMCLASITLFDYGGWWVL